MNNPYTASFDEMRELYVAHHKRETRRRLDRLHETMTREEIQEQLDTKSGAVMDDINASVQAQSNQSEAVEFICALQLADFYFPNTEKEVSFELRRDVDPDSVKTFEQLMGSFEDHTHIDCEVRANGKIISFQLKRYRGDSSPQKLVDWLNARVFKHYGPMNGTSLVVLLQLPYDPQMPFALDVFYELFSKEALPNVSFDAVSLMYNDATSDYMVLHELHPRHHRKLIDLNLALARMRGDA